MKKFIFILMLLSFNYKAIKAEDIPPQGNYKIEDVINLKYTHSLDYYLNSALKRSPELWERNTIGNFGTILGKSFPTMNYSRTDSDNSQTYSISIDVSQLIRENEERENQIEKLKFTKSKLINQVTTSYTEALTLENYFFKTKEQLELRNKRLEYFKKLEKKGLIETHKVTELQIEIVENELKLNNTKKDLIKTILNLYYLSGIKPENKNNDIK